MVFCTVAMREISIHALREEGDGPESRRPARYTYFYPRPPRGGRRPNFTGTMESHQFLSTPSARRATIIASLVHTFLYISIHALREEGDVLLAQNKIA